MHVMLVTTSYPDAGSGSEAAGGFVADFAQELSRHVKVSVVAASGIESSERHEGTVLVHRFGVRRWPLSLLNPLSPGDWGAILATLRGGQRAVQRAVQTDRPDYILGLWALPSGAWAKRTGLPYGIWALGSDIWGLGRIPVLRSFLRRVLRRATDRFADGLQLGRQVENIGGMPCDFLPSSRKLEVGAVSDPSGSAPYRLAFLGRWHANKGVDIFLHALRQLSPDDWERIAEVRVHGGGPLEAEVHALVDELRGAGRPVTAGGYLDTREAAEFIAWSDYLVLPSRVESIPVIFSDAAQLRRPLVATPVGDLPDLFQQNEFGVLADAPTPDAFADALHRALRTPASRFRAQLDRLSSQFDVGCAAKEFVDRLEARSQ